MNSVCESLGNNNTVSGRSSPCPPPHPPDINSNTPQVPIGTFDDRQSQCSIDNEVDAFRDDCAFNNSRESVITVPDLYLYKKEEFTSQELKLNAQTQLDNEGPRKNYRGSGSILDSRDRSASTCSDGYFRKRDPSGSDDTWHDAMSHISPMPPRRHYSGGAYAEYVWEPPRTASCETLTPPFVDLPSIKSCDGCTDCLKGNSAPPGHTVSGDHTLLVNVDTGEVVMHLGVPLPHLGSISKDDEGDVLKISCSGNVQDGHGCNSGPSSSTAPAEKENTKTKWTFSSGIGEPSVYHALVVIFLEFFAWGLLTSPMITVLGETFPNYTFLMNGLIVGIKGILSFLSAPLIGALSDVWGRKFFLLITVFFTCLPIPFMKINTWWYFALISMSGVFAVTFSIVFAYVADVTDKEERSTAYGLVSATFAASLVTSPALGAYLGKWHSDDLVVGLATAIAVLDVFFIMVAVPESLPEKLRYSSSWSAAHTISWEQADPFTALIGVAEDKNILLISMTVFLSYLPEAGQYSCFFVYLRLVMGFDAENVAYFIAAVGILSVVAQTVLLSLLMKHLSHKRVIIVGLVFELFQLMWYGFGSQTWMMWSAGVLAAISSITYPAIHVYISTHTDADKQGLVQGILTGMRGLCSGLGPAVYGFIFYLFHVDLNQESPKNTDSHIKDNITSNIGQSRPHLVPGPPFVFGGFMVIVALLVAAFIPDGPSGNKSRRQSGSASDLNYERGHKGSKTDAAVLPLMDEAGVL